MKSAKGLLAELEALAGDGILDEEVGDEAGVGEGGLGDGGGVVLLQPGCDGGSFVGVPIPCYHRLNHHFLQGSISNSMYIQRSIPCIAPLTSSTAIKSACMMTLETDKTGDEKQQVS